MADMKHAALIVHLADKKGSMHAIPGQSVVPLVNLAREIRETGLLDIGGKNPAKVVGGVVIADWLNSPAIKFRCK
jgi:hypothetical protein